MSRYKAVETKATQVATRPSNVTIKQPSTASVYLEVEGTAPLIQHNFSQKAIEEMLRKHMGISVQREKKNPKQVLEDATIYNVDGKICLPPTAFKKGMLSQAGTIKGLKKTVLRSTLFVEGGSIPITYSKMVPKMDMVRTSGMNRAPDVRFRPMFEGWKARLGLQYSADLYSIDTVIDLLQKAGRGGVGEWRPERDGSFGTYRISRAISDEKEINEIISTCAPPLRPLVIPDWAMNTDIDPDLLARIAKEERGEEEEDESEVKGKKAS